MRIALTGPWEVVRSVLQSRLNNVPESIFQTTYTGTTASGAHTYKHDLGVTPEEVTYHPHANFTAWHTEADKKLWTENTITFRADSASKAITLEFKVQR